MKNKLILVFLNITILSSLVSFGFSENQKGMDNALMYSFSKENPYFEELQKDIGIVKEEPWQTKEIAGKWFDRGYKEVGLDLELINPKDLQTGDRLFKRGLPEQAYQLDLKFASEPRGDNVVWPRDFIWYYVVKWEKRGYSNYAQTFRGLYKNELNEQLTSDTYISDSHYTYDAVHSLLKEGEAALGELLAKKYIQAIVTRTGKTSTGNVNEYFLLQLMLKFGADDETWEAIRSQWRWQPICADEDSMFKKVSDFFFGAANSYDCEIEIDHHRKALPLMPQNKYLPKSEKELSAVELLLQKMQVTPTLLERHESNINHAYGYLENAFENLYQNEPLIADILEGLKIHFKKNPFYQIYLMLENGDTLNGKQGGINHMDESKTIVYEDFYADKNSFLGSSIHEFTHQLLYDIYKNGSNPYIAGDKRREKDLDEALAQVMYNIFELEGNTNLSFALDDNFNPYDFYSTNKRKAINLLQLKATCLSYFSDYYKAITTITNIFSYDPKKRSVEVMVRLMETIADGTYNDPNVQKVLEPLMHYWNRYIAADLKAYLSANSNNLDPCVVR